MLKKLIGIFICTLMIATVFSAVTSLKNCSINAIVSDYTLISMLGSWTETQKIMASDGAAGDNFGISVSLDGNTAIIGAWWDDDNGPYSGSVYVFILIGTTWTQQAKLLPLDGVMYDQFGFSVSLSGDTALIGAPDDDNENGENSGSAYVFTRTEDTWTQEAKLLASDGAAEDIFGDWVVIDDDTALIDAPYADNQKGSVYVFTRTENTWTQEAKLLASDGAAYDWFGVPVALLGDTAFIGAPHDDDKGNNAGSVYVFTRTGDIWTQEVKLLASDGAAMDYFGFSISLNGDNAFIGAQLDDDNGADSGSVYVFTRTGDIWTQEAKLLASDGAIGDNFGTWIALENDTAIISAYLDDDNGVDSGSAYVFTRTEDTWTQEAKLLASDGAEGDWFGTYVALDDNTALISAIYDDDNGYSSGSAYIFIKENQPPGAPTITGPDSGKTGTFYEFTFNAVDPDNNQVKYLIDWGDGKSDTTALNPSGLDVTVPHAWSEQGEYTIKVHAQDEFGLDGLESTKTVSMPRNRTITWNSIIMKILEHFPLLERIFNLQ